MFQDFEAPADVGQTAERVARVRALLSKAALDALIVPRADEHQAEYVPASAERLRWVTGFSGSAGMAVIAARTACLFTDGRYTLQVRSQTDVKVFELRQVPEQKMSDWLVEKLPKGAVVGFDPRLHTLAAIEELRRILAKAQIRLRPTRGNLVDRAWGRERPPEPMGKVIVQPMKHAGVSAADKIARLQKKLRDEAQDAVVLTAPDSICWLLNIRGSDVAHNPVALAFAIVPATARPELFIASGKLDAETRTYLSGVAKLADPAQLMPRLAVLAEKGRRVRLDPSWASFAIARAVGRRNIARGADPCIEPKARKCPAEIKGARAAHVRDGVAMARFLAWLDANAASGKVDEIGAARELERFRSASAHLRDISFNTISGSGPNGAIVHYRVTEATNRRLGSGELFLIDSGAQYADGTTDITRTIAIGKPTREMCERYTAVLKGHIAVSTALFPAGTRGVELDAMARRALWSMGLDFDHGTGHGVGSYLSVHEGPAGISKRAMVPLEPGMILSNEPGYYKTGGYGIRIENLILVEAPKLPEGGERRMLSFETLTLAPYDRRLIVTDMLTVDERAFVDTYHARVAREIGPALDSADKAWLTQATARLR